MLRQGLARQARPGAGRLVKLWRGMAGKAGFGVAWYGREWLARLVGERRGKVWIGAAGMACLG